MGFVYKTSTSLLLRTTATLLNMEFILQEITAITSTAFMNSPWSQACACRLQTPVLLSSTLIHLYQLPLQKLWQPAAAPVHHIWSSSPLLQPWHGPVTRRFEYNCDQGQSGGMEATNEYSWKNKHHQLNVQGLKWGKKSCSSWRWSTVAVIDLGCYGIPATPIFFM